MTTHHDPLNAEERELAARLARLGGAREPAPALDARILAAARAAVAAPEASTTATVATAASTGDSASSATATTPADRPASPAPHDTQASGGGTVVPMRSRRPAARWPLGFGLAASVVLAAGIGWRMYGNGAGDEQAMSDAALKTVEAPPPPEESVTEMVELEPPMQRTPPPEPPPLEPYQAKAPPPPPEPVLSADAIAEPEAPTTYEFTMDESVHHDAADAAAAAPPPAPPAPAAPPAPVAKVGAAEARRAESDRSLDSIQVTGSRVRAATANEGVAPVLEIERARAPAPARGAAGAPPPPAATVAHESDAFDEQPPLSADSPEVRQAWFKRIRELLAAGRHDAAVESLQEFRRRYPTVELPQDLRKLASTLPAPTP